MSDIEQRALSAFIAAFSNYSVMYSPILTSIGEMPYIPNTLAMWMWPSEDVSAAKLFSSHDLQDLFEQAARHFAPERVPEVAEMFRY